MSTRSIVCQGMTATGPCTTKATYGVEWLNRLTDQEVQVRSRGSRVACGVHMPQIVKWSLSGDGDEATVYRLFGGRAD